MKKELILRASGLSWRVCGVLIWCALLAACGQAGELRHPDAPETEQPDAE